jgi:hypothetical protein
VKLKPVDEGLAPLHAVKHAISREVGHDPYRLVAYVQRVEKRYAAQIAAARRKAKKPRGAGRGKRAAGK